MDRGGGFPGGRGRAGGLAAEAKRGHGLDGGRTAGDRCADGDFPLVAQASASGGEVVTISKPDPSHEEGAHGFEHILPNGKQFLFLASVVPRDSRPLHRLYAGSIDSGATTFITELSSKAEYLEPGCLIYAREGSLMAQRFDLNTLRLSGEPMLVAGSVFHFRPTGLSRFSVSRSGIISYEPATEPHRLVKVDGNARLLEELMRGKSFYQIRISPLRDQVAVSVVDPRNGTSDLWLYGLNRPTRIRFTSAPGYEDIPVWAPDGASIYFTADRKGWPDIFRKEVDDASVEGEVVVTDGSQFPTDISPDGRFLLYHNLVRGSESTSDLFVLPLEKNAQPYPFAQTPFEEPRGRFSGDGKWVAYQSNESGRYEVYLLPFPGPGLKIQVSTEGGDLPRWSMDDKRLYFRNGRKLMAVEFTSPIGVGTPQPSLVFESWLEFPQYEVLGDGQGFLMVLTDEALAAPSAHLILNWRAGRR